VEWFAAVDNISHWKCQEYLFYIDSSKLRISQELQGARSRSVHKQVHERRATLQFLKDSQFNSKESADFEGEKGRSLRR
jgi:hypothetical protein